MSKEDRILKLTGAIIMGMIVLFGGYFFIWDELHPFIRVISSIVVAVLTSLWALFMFGYFSKKKQ